MDFFFSHDVRTVVGVNRRSRLMVGASVCGFKIQIGVLEALVPLVVCGVCMWESIFVWMGFDACCAVYQLIY